MDVKAAGRSPTNCWCVRVLRVGVVRCGEQWLMHWLASFATDVNLHVKELRAIEVVFLSASLHWLQAPLTWLDGSLAVLFFYRRCLTDPPRVHACRSNRMNSFATAT